MSGKDEMLEIGTFADSLQPLQKIVPTRVYIKMAELDKFLSSGLLYEGATQRLGI